MSDCIEGKIGAWMFARYNIAAKLTGDPVAALASMTYSQFDLSIHGYVKVGDAQMAVTLLPRSEVTAGAVAELRKQADKVRAESQASLTEIDRRINELLAIEHSEAT